MTSRLAAPAAAATATATPLEVQGLAVSYPLKAGGWVPVLDDVSFSLLAGETLGLVGESGSGKSMTALSVLRLHEMAGGRVDAGSIRYYGTELTDLSSRAMSDLRGKEISMIFQNASASLDPAFTVGRQLTQVLTRHTGVSRRQAGARAVELLAKVGIPEPKRRVAQYPHEFSGGMCQRVMIALALACGPRILLADEPTTALDVTTQAQIIELIQSLSAEGGMSTIFTTHDLSLVSQMCDRVAVMYAGQIVEVGTVSEIFSAPTHPYTQALLDCAAEPAGRGDFAPIEGHAPSPFARPPGCSFHPRCTYAQDVCRATDVELRTVHGARRSRCLFARALDLPGVPE